MTALESICKQAHIAISNTQPFLRVNKYAELWYHTSKSTCNLFCLGHIVKQNDRNRIKISIRKHRR